MDNELRTADEDLQDYLRYNSDIFTVEDVHTIHAEVPGHNDEMDWFWVIELTDGRFVLTQAGCDYTGWDCQSGGESQITGSAEAAAMLAPEMDSGRPIRAMLLAQMRGEQPFGVETISFK
jgi:hypothetical protein